MLQRIPDEMREKGLNEISRDDVRGLAFKLIEEGLSRSTAAGLLRTISAVFNAAAEDGIYRGANPALRLGRILRIDNGDIEMGPEEAEDLADAKESDDTAEVDCMDQEEAAHFLKGAEEHFPARHPLFLVALRTAARQGEVVALSWGAVDWNGKFITIKQTAVNNKIQKTKNRKTRRVPITAQLIEALKKHKRRAEAETLSSGVPLSPWIFPSPTGGLMDPSKLRKEFKAALRKAKLRHLTFHSLRHTALTSMAESGVPMAAIQRIAGHSSIQITAQYYLHVSPEAHQETIQALEAIETAPHAPRNDASKMRVVREGESESCVSA